MEFSEHFKPHKKAHANTHLLKILEFIKFIINPLDSLS
jgi:hypothetical protein